MRVLHVDYQQLRRYGHTRVSWAQKLLHGLIKNDFRVLSFSDRDVAAFEAPFGIRDLGKRQANKRLIETCRDFAPDLIIAGHCDIITNETFQAARKLCPNVVIAHCNNDPLFVASNVERIKHRADIADAIFVSTGLPELKQFEGLGSRLYHMPNPVDPAIECEDNSVKNDLPIDLLFCSNSNNMTARLETVKELRQRLPSALAFKTYGSFGEPPVWGRDYDLALSRSRMALNFSRQNGHYWYASARMAQLAGNGILAFTHDSHRFDELLPKETIPYFSDDDDLCKKIVDFHHDDVTRKTWAHNARVFFHTEMNVSLYARYIVEASMQLPFQHDYVWDRR